MAQPAPATPLTLTAGTGRPVTAEPVPVAFIGRTSTLALQDPRASLRRQLRSAQEWLPPGWFIAAVYWDIESGGIDLEQRSQGDAYKQFTDSGIPRDGGMADLLTEATAPAPRFAAVVCEDIERSGRDMFNALKLEKELSRQGIPLFATDEPADIEGVNATTVLIRRVKQGVAEWFRLQLKEKIWKGLIEHSLDGWNIGSPPYGYAAERIPHPVPFKAAQGRTVRAEISEATLQAVTAILDTSQDGYDDTHPDQPDPIGDLAHPPLDRGDGVTSAGGPADRSSARVTTLVSGFDHEAASQVHRTDVRQGQTFLCWCNVTSTRFKAGKLARAWRRTSSGRWWCRR
jgi:Resolvase, N terminal domain